MKGRLTVIVSIWGATTPAAADISANPLATPWERPQATYVITHPSLPAPHGASIAHLSGFSNIIYLNNCVATNGCAVSPGDDDAINNTSGVPSYPSVVGAWNAGSTAWQQLVQCVKTTYAPFNVQVVTERPPPGTNYHMAIVGGRPQDVGMGSDVGGVSEFTCGYIPNGISFSFANIYGGNVDQICWTVAQETAHSWGLDHKFDNRDPMTYLVSGPARKTFQNSAAACGELHSRKCQCGGDTMNSFQEVLDTFGPSAPTPPVVTIDQPRDGATVDKSFPIQVSIVDDLGVAKAELYIDGRLRQPVLMNPPFTWTADATVGQGAHAIKVIGYDVAGTPQIATTNVALGAPCGGAQACLEAGQVCVDGRCVAGSDTAGGLGASCTGNAQCISQACASDGDGQYCVESCDASCPAGFECVTSGSAGSVCWPTSGGCSASGASTSPLVVVVIAMLITRRKRR